MPKRIDPIRHWSIVIFILLAVAGGILSLPLLAHLGHWSLDAKNPRDLKYTALALAAVFLLEFTLWTKLLELYQNRRDKRAKKKSNPYDQK